MTTVELLSYLRSLNVRLWDDGERLRYNAPSGVLTKALHAEIVEKKVEILTFLRQARAAVNSTSPSIQPVSRSGMLPLSFAQSRLWFLEQLTPGNWSYNISAAVRLMGYLHVNTLSQTLDEIVRRHESLRTTFGTVNGEPIQVIDEPSPQLLPMVDLRGLSEDKRTAQVQQLATFTNQRPFNLAAGPMIRGSLLEGDSNEYTVLFTMHHIISDGWSMEILIREVGALYEAFSKGTTSNLEELTIQYADFAHWQRQWMRGEVLDKHLDYWKCQLGRNLPVMELPTDFPHSAVQSFNGASQSILLPKSLSEGLNTLNKQEVVTPFMTALAAFQILLYYYTGQDDLVVGTDVANRNRTETEGLVGFFVNQLVLRTDLSGNPTFRDLLRRVREVTLAAYVHQDMPFDKLVEALKLERTLHHSPLFQVKIVFQNFPAPLLELPELTLSPLEVESKTAKFDLTLFIHDADVGQIVSLEYNTELFNADTITQMLSHFETILGGIVVQPDARLNTLEEKLTETERKQRTMAKREYEASNFKKFKQIQRKTISLPEGELITRDYLHIGGMVPVVQPKAEAIDLADWAKNNRGVVQTKLLEHGILLFRGFNLDSPVTFEEFSLAICPKLFKNNGEHTPVSANGNVQIPVFYPPDKKLLWHNENSFNSSWPMKIMFHCKKPAQQGGEMVLVDSRKVFELIDPKIRAQFMKKQVMYVRNFSSELGLDWQTVFQTTSKGAVEANCQKNGVDFEWKDRDRLKTVSLRPAIGKHPKTGEMVWFNQAQHWHVSCLDSITRESLFALFSEVDLPRCCYYGDGSPIEDSIMQEICQVYQNLEVLLPWEKEDVLVLDNMLTAHGRNPFVGSREILVAMGEMSSHEDISI